MNTVDTTGFSALPTATGGIARLAYAHAQRLGFDPRLLLRKTGLSERQIEDRNIRLPVRAQIEFLTLIAASLGDEFLGVHLAEFPDIRELGLIFYVAASSSTLGNALQRASRYSTIVNEGLSVRRLVGEHVRIVFEYVGVPRHSDRHQIEFFMVMLVRLCRHLTDRHLTPVRVRIAHHRSNWGRQFAPFFGGNVAFGAETDEVAFAASINDLMVSSGDPYLNELLVANCERALTHRRATRGPFQTEVENAIVPLLPHGAVRAREIATRIGLSQRTAARRLASEGVTFSEVLERLRVDLARQYLSEPDLSVSRIAWLLGYQEVSAFTHAFKRWTGKTPREARD